MKRLAAALSFAFLLAVAPQALARGLAANGGPIPYHAPSTAPTGLHGFLLRPDERAQTYFPRTPSFAWNPVAQRGGHYEFELATSRTFNEAAQLFGTLTTTTPAIALDQQLPWMTGVPYALWAHVRWVSADGKTVTPWGAPFGFNMRWADSDYPKQLDAPPGMVRWKPVEGATAYEVLYPDLRPASSFQTTTNVADEREYFTLHDLLGWGAAIHWRVRAIRAAAGLKTKNGIPAVSYGPWSQTFTSVNPPKSLSALAPTATISDNWDKPGHAAAAHELTPGFAWQASAPAVTDVANFGSSLYRVYISTDDHCVNTVFTSSLVGSPAFAPRSTKGPRALPGSSDALADYMSSPYLHGDGAQGKTLDATGDPVSDNETVGKGVDGSTTSDSTAHVDLWDSGWPTGRYYWTVVPVTVMYDGVPKVDAATGKVSSQTIEYHDTAVPQDACESGRGMSFGKVSQPVVTEDGTPWVSGLAPSGRYVASASASPAVHDSPLVAWQPAIGATSYEIELSHKSYPWKAAKKLKTAATAIVLPLGKSDIGTWWYRVRGINPALPAGAQAMSWSKAVQLRVTGDQYVVVK